MKKDFEVPKFRNFHDTCVLLNQVKCRMWQREFIVAVFSASYWPTIISFTSDMDVNSIIFQTILAQIVNWCLPEDSCWLGQ